MPVDRRIGVVDQLEIIVPFHPLLHGKTEPATAVSVAQQRTDCGRRLLGRGDIGEDAPVAQGGLLVADNTLWSGRVAGSANDEHTVAIRAFNDRVNGDPRVENVLLAVRDGIMLARKIG